MLLLLIARIRVAVNRSQMKVTCSALNSFFQDAIQVLIIFFTKMGGYAFIFHRVLGRTTSCMESYVFIKVWAWGKVIIMHWQNDLLCNVQDSKTIRILRPPEAPTISGLPTNSLRFENSLEGTCWLNFCNIISHFHFSQGWGPVDSICQYYFSLSLSTGRGTSWLNFSLLLLTFTFYREGVLLTQFSILLLTFTFYREGDQLTLTCNSHHGNPLPTLKWYKQGEYIPTQVRSRTRKIKK